MVERADLRRSLDEALDAAGLRHRVVTAGYIVEMQRSLLELVDRGIAPGEILAEYARSLTFTPPEGMGPVLSLIVVAASSPPRLVTFDLGDRQIEAVIPPTYVSSEIRSRDLEVLSGVLQPAGYDVRRVTLPAKMLAVRAGLAEYGRNGLAYVEGLGSFVRLDVFGTDAPLVDDEEAAAASALLEGLPVPPRMRRCLACAWCYHACPTTCIDPGGDRIDPLRCLTFLNEHEGEWPEELRPDAHNCLVGCMCCQLGCRVNLERGYLLPPVPAAHFDKEETAMVLQNLPEERLPEPLREKLEALDLADYSTVLGRNLRALAGC